MTHAMRYSGTMPPVVSAIVLNYRSPKDTVKCVEALLSQSLGSEIEIIIVDNHSHDESIGWIRARFGHESRVSILETRGNIGYGRGNNLGASIARGEYVLIVNPDNILPQNSVACLLSQLQKNPDVAIVGPALVYPDGTVRPSARAFPVLRDLFHKRLLPEQWHRSYERNMATKNDGPVRVDWLVGACLLVRSAVFHELRGFDERFFLFFEDIDFCRRARTLGYGVLYDPTVRVHDRKQRLSEGGVLSPLWKKTTRVHLVSAWKYFRKWGFGLDHAKETS